MKQYFPKPNIGYLQTNRSDELGSIWSSFNLDFQKNLGSMKLSDKLVTNTTSSDDAGLGLPVAFEVFDSVWWAICGTKIFKSSTDELTTTFTADTSFYVTGGSDETRYDITNPSGTTFRYTYNGTGTNPNITAVNYPIGARVKIQDTDFNNNNEGTFIITGSGNNYFEVTNASGVAENDIVIGFRDGISVSGGPFGSDYSPLYSDMAYFNNFLFLTTQTALRVTVIVGAGDETISNIATLQSGINHKLLYFKKTNRLYFNYNTQQIRSLDDTYSVSTSGTYTLDLNYSPSYFSTMVSNSSHIWIGTSLPTGSSKTRGTIIQWDGISAQPTNEFPIEAGGIVAMCVNNDTPYAIDTEGRILEYNGYSFKEIQRLPIDRMLLVNATALGQRFIHPNGFIPTKNNTLLINVNNLNEDANSTINENLPSGIWELDLSTGNLTNKYAPTLKSMSSSTVTDFGQNRIVNAGAIKMGYRESDSTAGRSTLLAGFSYYTDATTTKSGIFIDSPDKPNTDNEGQKRGYFVSTWYESPEVESTWTKIWAIYKRFKNSTDKIIFKYRLEEEDPIEATITWTSTSTFTTTTNISAYAGYEAEIIQGTGSGACTNITSVTELAGTYTATIDTAITGVTGTAKARFQKWKKIYPVASGTVKSYTEMPFDATNVRIQIKGILEWTGDGEFSKFILMDDEDIISNL
jgi:hypothetical protein